MFQRRLKMLLVVLAAPAALLVVRLVQLQVVQAAAYRERARQMLIRPERFFPFLRGRITDRAGRPLAYDAQSWDISVHYGILTGDKDYLRALAEKNAAGPRRRLETAVEESWETISQIAHVPREQLDQVREGVVARVQRIKSIVSDHHGVEMPVAEEHMFHPVARDLSREAQVEARILLAAYPWVEVVASHARRYAGGEAVGHFLGLLCEVSEAAINNDPHIDDKLSRYQPGDQYGFCGVEAMAERVLRGRRGREQLDLEGRPVGPDAIEPPRHGEDFRLTIDLPLQQAVYQQLADAVRRYPYSTGGSAVILEVPSRRIRAMVSYPSFDANLGWGKRMLLAGDWRHQPLMCRAIGEGRAYPPGSAVKPMILAGALTAGMVQPDEHITCRGHLLPEAPGKWRCAAQWGHGDVDPVTSIARSCNVFYYVVGERAGVDLLASWMAQFGVGQSSGTGLREENPGNLPRSGGRGDARNMSIGQWQLEMTPVQVANMTATIATGRHGPVVLWADQPDGASPRRLQVSEQSWHIVRRGMYQAVNEHGGTAFGPERATLPGDCPYVLLGKTGSAEAPPQESLYTCRFADGRIETRQARSFAELRAACPDGDRPELLSQQPAAVYPTHGWFAGYLSRPGRCEAPVADGDFSLAIAVVIEYAGHGGDVAAHVARDMILAGLDQQEDGGVPAAPGAGERP